MNDEPVNLIEACREQALKLLEYRPHAIAELKQKLIQRKKYPTNVIQQVIADLINVNLLNDKDFAILFCQSLQASSSPIGRVKAQLKLRQKGVPQTIIQEVFDTEWNDQDDELQRALTAARQKWTSLARKNEEHFLRKQKLARFLASRGFQSQIISKVLASSEYATPR